MSKLKTTLTIDQVKHVSKLANLNLNNRELCKFQKQLSSILNFVSKLNKVNTKNVDPTSQVTGLVNVFREDEAKPSLSSKEALSNTHEHYKGFFKIKAIFEK